MHRFRRDHLSDETAEWMLSGTAANSAIGAVARELREAGPTPPQEAVAARHLAAIVAEARLPAQAVVASPRRRGGRAAFAALMPVRFAAGATALVAMLALTLAGALPGPVQAAASDVLGVVGISVPDGHGAAGRRGEAPAPARKRPERFTAPATVTLPDAVDQVTPRREDDPVEAPRGDQARPGASDGERDTDGARDRDDGGDRDDERGPSTQREPDGDESADESDKTASSGKDDAGDESGNEGTAPDSGDHPERSSSGGSGPGIDERDEPEGD